MRRVWLGVVVVLIVAAMACNLTGGDETESTATPTVTSQMFQPVVTLSPAAFLTPSPTTFGGALPDASQVPPTRTGCTQANWFYTYTVGANETLSTIADRTGGAYSYQQIADGNCLEDPNVIFVGQQLLVPIPIPTLAPPITPVNTPVPDPDAPRVTVFQHWIGTDGVPVANTTSVAVDAGQVPSADVVDFYVVRPGASAVLFASDDDPWNQAQVTYTFPATGTYTFYAVARNSEGAENQSNQFTVRYDPTFLPPGETLPNRLIIEPATLSGGVYFVSVGNTVTVAWPDAPATALSIRFTLVPDDPAMPTTTLVDNSRLDGALVPWLPPSTMSGVWQAEAVMPTGSANQFSDPLLVEVQ
ncbi:MAG: LysM peptidoglycan-binding domain-containing protein [Chloroflexi bacterium]|nr:LysM peptidoglycan-binding domain-containing protein [Chloroflexota bacterium]